MVEWNWLSVWMLLAAWLVGYYPAIWGRRCSACGNEMEGEGRLELLTQHGDWYLGWRRFSCTVCHRSQMGVAATRDASIVQGQIHVVRRIQG